MSKKKKLKREVRARMARTGESYQTAHLHRAGAARVTAIVGEQAPPKPTVLALADRERLGELRPNAVAIAAHLGNPEARQVLGWGTCPASGWSPYPGVGLDEPEWVVTRHKWSQISRWNHISTWEWADRLCAWDPEIAMRAAVALGRLILPEDDDLARIIETTIATGAPFNRRRFVDMLEGVWLLVSGVVRPTRERFQRDECLAELIGVAHEERGGAGGFPAMHDELAPFLFNERDPLRERLARSVDSVAARDLR